MKVEWYKRLNKILMIINYGAVMGINERIIGNVTSLNNQSIQNDIQQAKAKIADIKELNSDI